MPQTIHVSTGSKAVKPETSLIRFTSTTSVIRLSNNLSIFDPPATHAAGFAAVSKFAEIRAEEAIAEKAAQLGPLPGNPTSNVQSVGDGFVQSFQGCVIYVSDATGAHEVHGDMTQNTTHFADPLASSACPSRMRRVRPMESAGSTTSQEAPSIGLRTPGR